MTAPAPPPRTPPPAPPSTTPPPTRPPLVGRGVLVVAGLVAAAVLLQPRLVDALDGDALQTWATVFVAISVQALPFLTLGVVLAGGVAAFVSPATIDRILPSRPALAVPTAGLAGLALPGCECGSVPVSGRLVAGGAPPAAALTFLLAAPAINPVVLVSTAVAFPDEPEMVVARFTASLATALVVGWIWIRVGDDSWVERARRRTTDEGSPWERFRDAAVHDMLHAGGYLVLGAGVAAALQTFVPTDVLDSIGGSEVAAILAMAALAIVLSICSEADAFVAASFTSFSPTAQLVFMVVGPVVDLKLVALQVGVFSKELAVRFAPLTLLVATSAATLAGTVLL